MKATIKMSDGREYEADVEIKEESKSWKPKRGEKYLFCEAGVGWSIWNNDSIDNLRYSTGNCFRTKEEAQNHYEWLKARATLMRSTDFVPDWNNANQVKWFVYYDHIDKMFIVEGWYARQYATIYFPSEEAAEKSIKTHEKEWKIYFGIK